MTIVDYKLLILSPRLCSTPTHICIYICICIDVHTGLNMLRTSCTTVSYSRIGELGSLYISKILLSPSTMQPAKYPRAKRIRVELRMANISYASGQPWAVAGEESDKRRDMYGLVLQF